MITVPSDIGHLTGATFAEGEVPTWDAAAEQFVPGAGANGAAYSEIVGDGAAVEFDIVHGLGTESIVVEAWSASVRVAPTLLVLDVDTVRVTFLSAPAVSDGLVVVLAAGGTLSGDGALVQTRHDLNGPNGGTGLSISSTAGSYVFLGDALTAHTEQFWFDQFPERWRPVLLAKWRLVWTPNDPSNGMRLIHADSGPSNVVEIHEFTGLSDVNPIISEYDLTTEFNSLIGSPDWKTIAHQGKVSTGSVDLWASWLTILWDIPVGGGGGSSSPLTTKGDLYGHDGTVGNRLPVGTNGQQLVADSAETLGLKWTDAVDVQTAGRWEVVVSGNPAEAVTNEAGDDWLYTWTEN